MAMTERAFDERLLHMLALHTQKVPLREIARRTGVNRTQTQREVSNVIKDDIAHDPEAAAYWDRIKPRRKET